MPLIYDRLGRPILSGTETLIVDATPESGTLDARLSLSSGLTVDTPSGSKIKRFKATTAATIDATAEAKTQAFQLGNFQAIMLEIEGVTVDQITPSTDREKCSLSFGFLGSDNSRAFVSHDGSVDARGSFTMGDLFGGSKVLIPRLNMLRNGENNRRHNYTLIWLRPTREMFLFLNGTNVGYIQNANWTNTGVDTNLVARIAAKQSVSRTMYFYRFRARAW